MYPCSIQNNFTDAALPKLFMYDEQRREEFATLLSAKKEESQFTQPIATIPRPRRERVKEILGRDAGDGVGQLKPRPVGLQPKLAGNRILLEVEPGLENHIIYSPQQQLLQGERERVGRGLVFP